MLVNNCTPYCVSKCALVPFAPVYIVCLCLTRACARVAAAAARVCAKRNDENVTARSSRSTHVQMENMMNVLFARPSATRAAGSRQRHRSDERQARVA